MCLPIQQWHSGFHGFIKLITLTRFDVGLIPIGAYNPRWYVSSNHAFFISISTEGFPFAPALAFLLFPLHGISQILHPARRMRFRPPSV